MRRAGGEWGGGRWGAGPVCAQEEWRIFTLTGQTWERRVQSDGWLWASVAGQTKVLILDKVQGCRVARPEMHWVSADKVGWPGWGHRRWRSAGSLGLSRAPEGQAAGRRKRTEAQGWLTAGSGRHSVGMETGGGRAHHLQAADVLEPAGARALAARPEVVLELQGGHQAGLRGRAACTRASGPPHPPLHSSDQNPTAHFQSQDVHRHAHPHRRTHTGHSHARARARWP